MSIITYEIRICPACGLRYPYVLGGAFGTRCPDCLGQTDSVLIKGISQETRQPARKRKPSPRLAILLDNIRSAQNVGSILRSADGYGFEHAYLGGITATPIDSKVNKTALGAEETLPWSVHKNAVELILTLKQEGWKIYALEEAPNAVDISRVKIPANQKTVLIVGNEVTGVDPSLLEIADKTLAIPMLGIKRSFNVAVAFAIAAYALRYGNTVRRIKAKSTRAPATTSRR